MIVKLNSDNQAPVYANDEFGRFMSLINQGIPPPVSKSFDSETSGIMHPLHKLGIGTRSISIDKDRIILRHKTDIEESKSPGVPNISHKAKRGYG